MTLTDPRFRVELIAQTPSPQRVIWAAMHQDYSEGFVAAEREAWPDEKQAGKICVKRLLAGDRGHYGCYDSITEVLTSDGWMAWPDVKEQWDSDCSPNLLAVDIANGTCHFEAPKDIQAIELLDGDQLYSLGSQYLNFAVTLDHRMVVSHRQTGGAFSLWYFKRAIDVLGKPVRYLLNSCLASDCRSLPDDMPVDADPLTAFKLAGFFFGDGLRSNNKNPFCIRFRIRRPRKIAYLLSLGLPTEEKKGDRYTIARPDLARWIHKHFSNSSGKVVPVWILTLPEELVAAFWDGLKNSDGTRIVEKSWAYDSSDKESLDLIQALAHINGFSANMSLNNPNEGPEHVNHKPCWRLTIAENSTRRVEACYGRSPGVSESLIDYSGFVYCATVSTGALMVRRKNKVFVSGNCLEHPAITLNAGWFPHSVMQQARTHRVGVSFDVQSMRYSGQRICDAAEGRLEIEDVFYLRPVGDYADRQGKKYTYTADQRAIDLNTCHLAAERYRDLMAAGFAEEHARGILPFDYRQHFVVSFSLRAFLHFLDLRAKLDAQEEIRALCDLMWPHLEAWVPEIAGWYAKTRLHKARLAP